MKRLTRVMLILPIVLIYWGASGKVALADTTTPEPLAGVFLQRFHEISDHLVGRHPSVVFIGDSITHGWEGDGRFVWQEYLASYRVANLGCNADRTEHVLWRLENGNLEGLNPKAAFLLIGTNNLRRDSSEAIADGIEAIVMVLRRQVPDIRITILGILPRGYTPEDPFRLAAAAANEVIRGRALEWGVVFRDIGRVFIEADGNISQSIMHDGVHLTELGYRKFARHVVDAVGDWSLF